MIFFYIPFIISFSADSLSTIILNKIKDHAVPPELYQSYIINLNFNHKCKSIYKLCNKIEKGLDSDFYLSKFTFYAENIRNITDLFYLFLRFLQESKKMKKHNIQSTCQFINYNKLIKNSFYKTFEVTADFTVYLVTELLETDNDYAHVYSVFKNYIEQIMNNNDSNRIFLTTNNFLIFNSKKKNNKLFLEKFHKYLCKFTRIFLYSVTGMTSEYKIKLYHVIVEQQTEMLLSTINIYNYCSDADKEEYILNNYFFKLTFKKIDLIRIFIADFSNTGYQFEICRNIDNIILRVVFFEFEQNGSKFLKLVFYEKNCIYTFMILPIQNYFIEETIDKRRKLMHFFDKLLDMNFCEQNLSNTLLRKFSYMNISKSWINYKTHYFMLKKGTDVSKFYTKLSKLGNLKAVNYKLDIYDRYFDLDFDSIHPFYNLSRLYEGNSNSLFCQYFKLFFIKCNNELYYINFDFLSARLPFIIKNFARKGDKFLSDNIISYFSEITEFSILKEYFDFFNTFIDQINPGIFIYILLKDDDEIFLCDGLLKEHFDHCLKFQYLRNEKRILLNVFLYLIKIKRKSLVEFIKEHNCDEVCIINIGGEKYYFSNKKDEIIGFISKKLKNK